MSSNNTISKWILLLLAVWLVLFRMTHVDKKEISWDVFGYYLPLEATFIAGDTWLNDRTWVEELNEKHKVTGTLYQITTTPDNKPMYFFFIGMSYMYSIFFFIGHFCAGMLGYAQDGLSPPYIYSLVAGCLIYTMIGLYYLRKILLTFFSDKLVAVLLIICVIGTNFAHHMTLKNLETVNVLFMFSTLVIWNTIQWYANKKLKNILMVGISIVMMGLIKPSEVLIIVLPLLWGVSNWEELRNRFKLLAQYKFQLLITVLIGFIIACPQLIYWYVKTGKFIYDSYKNPGVGLDLLSPHLWESLFGFRKGWLIYTPVMLFSLIGFFILAKRNKAILWGTLITFAISFYIIVSWTEYWYGAGFSNRPVIVQYPILLLPMGYFLQWLWEQKAIWKYTISGLIVFFVFLNQFYWWQLRNYILDPTRMTKAYFTASFLKTKVTQKMKDDLLLLSRSYEVENLNHLENPEDYTEKKVIHTSEIKTVDAQGTPLEFIETLKIPFNTLTTKDHLYVRFQCEYFLTDSLPSDAYVAMMMNRKNGDYSNCYFPLQKIQNKWIKFDTLFLTPELRNTSDNIKTFIWNRNKQPILVKNKQISVFEKKD